MNHQPQTDPQETLRSMMEQLLGAMTEKPEHLNVRLIPSHRKPTLVVTCDRLDYGAIAGKQGATLKSLKLLTAHMGMRQGLAANLILDEDGCTGERGSRKPFVADPNWDAEPLLKLANLFSAELLGNCNLALEPVLTGTSKLTIVCDESPSNLPEIEQALEAALNCAGVVQGQRIMVEIEANEKSSESAGQKTES